MDGMLPVKAFLDGIKGAGADIAKNNTNGTKGKQEKFFLKPA